MLNTQKIDAIIKAPQVAEMLGISKAALYRGAKAGRYPTPFKIGIRSSGWRLSDIQAIINNLK